MNIAPTQEMQAFTAVVDRGSFAAAAARLGLTPSAVSKLVGRLEDRLGVRLLHRTTRRLSLTSEGELYHDRIQPLLAQIEAAQTEIADRRATPSGLLRLNTSIGFAVHVLAPVLPRFTERYPEIELHVSATDRITDPVMEQADVTVRTGRVDTLDLAAIHLADYDRIVCAAPDYLARHGTPKHPDDLARHLCIVYASPRIRQWPFQIDGDVIWTENTRRVTTDSTDTALQMALDGVGVARVMDVMTDRHIRAGRLVPLLQDFHSRDMIAISALYAPGRHRLPKLRVFLEFLVEEFGTSPWQGIQPKRSVFRENKA